MSNLEEIKARGGPVIALACQGHKEVEAKARREKLMEQARRDIDDEVRRAIQDIRREVADMTVMATERVTRKVLSEKDQRELVEDALRDLDFSSLTEAR